MHPSTAAVLLKYLAREGLMDVSLSTFMVHRYPQVVHPDDVEDAFRSIVSHVRGGEEKLIFSRNFGIECTVVGRLFEKIYNVIWVHQKIHPEGKVEGSRDRGKEKELPLLFVGVDKTQVRQIPLAEHPPWPFKFLLELGGMVIVKTPDARNMILELRQFLNNYPQYEIRVDAKECPDGSYAIFTYWFRKLNNQVKRQNVNVP